MTTPTGTSGRTRTDTMLPPVDFESTMSTIPSHWHTTYYPIITDKRSQFKPFFGSRQTALLDFLFSPAIGGGKQI